MTLQEVLKEIEIQKGFQNADISPEIIHGRIPNSEIGRTEALAIAKRQAGSRIEELRNIYDRLVYKNAAVIFVTGDAAKRKVFAELAEKDEALVVSTDAFYTDIVHAAEAQMSMGRMMSMHVGQEVVARVARALSNLVPGTFTSYPKLPMESLDSVLKTSAEVLAVVKTVAKPCNDIPISLIWLQRAVAAIAFEKDFCSEPLAIVVNIEDAEDAKTWEQYFLQDSPSVSVSVDDYENPADALNKATSDLVVKLSPRPQS